MNVYNRKAGIPAVDIFCGQQVHRGAVDKQQVRYKALPALPQPSGMTAGDYTEVSPRQKSESNLFLLFIQICRF